MTASLPSWLDPAALLETARGATAREVAAAIAAETPGARELAVLLAPAAAPFIEPMAARARALTRRHFGNTMALYAPLYLSNFCSSGCVYCGFAADRDVPRRRLEPDEIDAELESLNALGIEEVLLLTGERTPRADFAYLADAVRRAARRFHLVTVEAFPMSVDEYRALAEAGCNGVTLYQETYAPAPYDALHRWGPKKDYSARLEAPARALEAGMRTVGLGALMGLADPVHDALCLYQHAQHLLKHYWRSGVSISFPRLRPQTGDFSAPHPVDDAWLARLIFAFRLCLPDVPLVLSTRESPDFRDGMAGLGISKMSVASRTTVGGYHTPADKRCGQFEVSDDRGIEAFCAMLRGKGLEPVFKSWDSVYRNHAA